MSFTFESCLGVIDHKLQDFLGLLFGQRVDTGSVSTELRIFGGMHL